MAGTDIYSTSSTPSVPIILYLALRFRYDFHCELNTKMENKKKKKKKEEEEKEETNKKRVKKKRTRKKKKPTLWQADRWTDRKRTVDGLAGKETHRQEGKKADLERKEGS